MIKVNVVTVVKVTVVGILKAKALVVKVMVIKVRVVGGTVVKVTMMDVEDSHVPSLSSRVETLLQPGGLAVPWQIHHNLTRSF